MPTIGYEAKFLPCPEQIRSVPRQPSFWTSLRRQQGHLERPLRVMDAASRGPQTPGFSEFFLLYRVQVLCGIGCCGLGIFTRYQPYGGKLHARARCLCRVVIS